MSAPEVDAGTREDGLTRYIRHRVGLSLASALDRYVGRFLAQENNTVLRELDRTKQREPCDRLDCQENGCSGYGLCDRGKQ